MRRVTKRGLGIVLLGGSLFTALAHAQEPPREARVSLRADIPEECADDAEFVHRVEALLGHRLDAPVSEALGVRLSVLGNAKSGYSAEIVFTSARGEQRRTLEHPSCSKLIEAAALVIALAIDPEAVEAVERARETRGEPAATVAPPAPAPPPVAAPVRDAASAPTPAPAPAASPLRGVRLGLAGALGAGPLPDLGAGLQATLGYRRSAWRVDVIGRYWATRSQSLSVVSEARADLYLATVGVRGCWLPLTESWSVAGCLGADLGEMSGTGVGLDANRTSRARYSALAASASVSYTRWRVAPELGFEFSRALDQPPFGVVNDGGVSETYRPAAWGLLAFLGLAFEL